MSKHPFVQVILVCQGAEYQAVCKGLSRATGSVPKVVPIPIGMQPVRRSLEIWQQSEGLHGSQLQVLVMGLCGSLNPQYGVGETVLYQSCADLTEAAEPRTLMCDRPLTNLLCDRLSNKSLVSAWTSDRVIHSAQEKYRLAQTYGTDVVDMEGFAILETLQSTGVAIAMLRVISDNCQHDLPNLAPALSPEGALKPLPLAIQMLRQPIAATRLIRGSLRGLQVLQQTTTALFSLS